MEVKEEDNKQLLMKVLHEHYKGRYSLVEEALTEINNYSKNPNKNSYRKVSNDGHSLLRSSTHYCADTGQTLFSNEWRFAAKNSSLFFNNGAAADNR